MTLAAPVIDVVPLGREHEAAVLELDQWAFGSDRSELPPEDEKVVADCLEWDRTHGAHRPGPDGRARLAGIYSARTGHVAVPGGADVACSGLTWVGVHPRDRRRGVLTSMMRHHLDDVAARGEPFSILYAAEATIYGRFGYGVAARALSLTLPRSPQWRDVPGADDLVVDLDHADPQRWIAPIAECYEKARRSRPGWLSRPQADVWPVIFLDPWRWRGGAETLRVLSVSTPEGELRGYALFGRKLTWEHHSPAGTVTVREAVTLDAAAARALWGRLADLDLTTGVTGLPLLPVDDPLPHLLVDPRAARASVTDGVWARLVDVPAALQARAYSRDVDVVLEVTDTFRPQGAGRWRLTGGPGGARCVPSDDAAQLVLDVRELGSAYFGGLSLTELAGAGLVEVRDASVLAAASTAFTSPVAPHCGWVF